MESQTTTNDWLAKEEESIKASKPANYEQLPSLKLVQNEVTEITIDFSKPFEKWDDEESHVIKSIIPVTKNGVRHNWWLNIKNPIYAEIIKSGRNGISNFKILQVGTGKSTKYTIVK